jgi:hypothetical protein
MSRILGLPSRTVQSAALCAGIALGGMACGSADSGAPDPPAQATADTVIEEAPTVEPEHKFTNKLIDETSPYLLQHAHNPVDWYPWGDDALRRAKNEDKPIFLSIGYSSCHWCHVMEHESFENEEIAALLNDRFISVKVDREERPDLDEIYMQAVVAMTGQGGWPMTVFLTPDLKPFFGGTYFPPESRFGRPGFRDLVTQLGQAWETRRDEINTDSEKIGNYLQQALGGAQGEAGAVTAELYHTAAQNMGDNFDSTHGGWGGAPKFPSSPTIQLLIRGHADLGDDSMLHQATHTLTKMARGGMYDHLGGGFHRYSTDEMWLLPHFEKMLYDNGQLAQVYLEAYQLTKDPLYKRVVEEIFTYQLRDMTGSDGSFYSTEDADSEGEEGKFYIWRYEEIVAALGEEDAAVFNAYYNIQKAGNFASHETYHHEQNVLHVPKPPEDVATELGLSVEELEAKLAPMREKLLAVRNERIRPGLDDKVLTAWNGLMISALAHGYQVLGDTQYRDAAIKAADFILANMVVDDTLMRSYRKGQAKHPGYLDDHAFLAVALIDLYEATFDPRWLREADAITQKMIARFWDEEGKGFFFTGAKHTNLLTRTKPTQDGAEPSGNSLASLALLRLAKLLDNADYYDKAEQTLRMVQPMMEKAPQGFLKALVVSHFYVNGPKEVAIAGAQDGADTRSLLDAVHGGFIPNKVLALIDNEADNGDLEKFVPLLAYKRPIDGKAAAYVCKNYACRRPVTTTDELLALLADEAAQEESAES